MVAWWKLVKCLIVAFSLEKKKKKERGNVCDFRTQRKFYLAIIWEQYPSACSSFTELRKLVPVHSLTPIQVKHFLTFWIIGIMYLLLNEFEETIFDASGKFQFAYTDGKKTRGRIIGLDEIGQTFVVFRVSSNI